jgi:AcrR family transcriptional regulator
MSYSGAAASRGLSAARGIGDASDEGRTRGHSLTTGRSGRTLLIMTALANRDRRAERRDATRSEILEAAWEIARQDGLAALTLRAVADRIGMRSPSLYSHFDSKNAIYDAMFAQAWSELRTVFDGVDRLPSAPRKAILRAAEWFFDFAVADLARYQLMNQRTIPDFRPSAEAYAESLADYELLRRLLRAQGVRSTADVDLWTALLGGFVDQQLANDPGGDRWRRQLPRAVDMFCDEVGVPGPRLRRAR